MPFKTKETITDEMSNAAKATAASTNSLKLTSNPNTAVGRAEMPTTRNTLPDQLLKVISNLYLNAPERLRLAYPPRCADDLHNCHQNHFRSDLPDVPNHWHTISLRNAYQQEQYTTFVSFAAKMCMSKVFPGNGIFRRLTELLLVCG